MSSASYGFRVRFAFVAAGTIISEDNFVTFETQLGMPLKFASADKRTQIRDSSQFAISGLGFDSVATATEAAESVCDALLLYAVRQQTGIDLGRDSISSLQISETGEKYIAEMLNAERIIVDKLGITVFEVDPKPTFFGMKMSGQTTSQSDFLTEKLASTVGKFRFTSLKAQLAADLYGVSHFVGRVPARFLLLVCALEAMLEFEPKSEDAVKHIDFLIEKTKTSMLSEQEAESILAGLRFLKRESISSSGRRLALQAGGDGGYGGEESQRFFGRIYKMRSQLVHEGKFEAKEMHSLIGELERLVKDAIESYVVE